MTRPTEVFLMVIIMISQSVSISGYARDQGATRIRRLCSDHVDHGSLPPHVRAICRLMEDDVTTEGPPAGITTPPPAVITTPPPAPQPSTTSGLCRILCSNGEGGALCNCGSMPPAYEGRKSGTQPESDIGRQRVDAVNCTVLCADGDGGAVCNCHDQPPMVQQVRVAGPVIETQDTPNCTVLCSTGSGGAICDCGDMPPLIFDSSNLEQPHRQMDARASNITCDLLCKLGEAPSWCDCGYPPAYEKLDRKSEIESEFDVRQQRTDVVNCTVLCADGDGGAVCNCHDQPPSVQQVRVAGPVIETEDTPNCTVLCSTGSGGAACNCGDMPPAIMAGSTHTVRRHQSSIACRHYCAVFPERAPRHCGCNRSENHVKSRRPQPPAQLRESLCDALCAQGTGGSLCECAGGDNLPPAMFYAVPPVAAPVVKPQPPTPDPAVPPLPYNPTIDCNMLCYAGKAGALCKCGNMPPAGPPPN